MATRVLWAAMIAALVVVGGGTYLWYQARLGGAPPGDGEEVRGQVERDGISLEVWTTRREYGRDDLVTIFGRVRHTGTVPFDYATPTPCSPDVQFTLETANGGLDLTYSTLPSIPCIQVLDARNLAPGGTLMHNATWDLQIPVDGEPSPAPAGEYVLTASFPPGDWQERPLTVRITIEVVVVPATGTVT